MAVPNLKNVSKNKLAALKKKAWKKQVLEVVDILYRGLLPDYIVLGGGNSKKFKHPEELPEHCRLGDNANAFLGGFRMWEEEWEKGIG